VPCDAKNFHPAVDSGSAAVDRTRQFNTGKSILVQELGYRKLPPNVCRDILSEAMKASMSADCRVLKTSLYFFKICKTFNHQPCTDQQDQSGGQSLL